jgi:succinate dehydrogenase / fumarate reductase cytochrome b subunit
VAQAITEQRGTVERNLFLIRRLHSLCGVIPIGVFLCFHLIINSTVAIGGERFQTAVDGIHLLKDVGLLYPVEIVFIFIPLVFHAILGVQIWLSGQQNVLQYRYGASIRYALQRWTAVVTLLFVLFHLWQMHWLGAPFGGQAFDPHDAPYTAALAMQNTPLYLPVYVVGLLCSVFHFCNGLWTFFITWGISISRDAQRRVGYLCLALGVFLSIIGLASATKLALTNPNTLRSDEPPHLASVPSDLSI